MSILSAQGLWKALGETAWLDIGNGWRNLFLLSCLLQAAALGVLFGKHKLIKSSRFASFLMGIACTPFVQYLWTLLLAFVWPHAPKLIYIGVLPGLAALYLLIVLFVCRKRLMALLRQGTQFALRIFRFDKPALVSLFFALAMGILLLPVCMRICGSTAASANGGDSGEYLALAQRFAEDRSLASLLEKEDMEGHFRGNSHFPSLELYMSYGLMHTSGDSYGHPFDKPALFAVGALTFYMIIAFAALLTALCRERKRWILLGMLLLNLVPNLFFSVNGAPRDIWRILALLLAALFFAELRPLGGGWKRYVGRLLAALVVCFTAMSAHVVCFVVLPFIVIAWVLARVYGAALAGDKSFWREIFGSVGIAISGAIGTLIAFSGNLWCYLKWGEMSPWRLMTTYVDAPWYNDYMLGEYKLEETTTQLHFWKDRYDIVLSYATPIGLWGMRLALIALLSGIAYWLWKRYGKRRDVMPLGGFQGMEPLVFTALLTLCTLAPMSGLLDTRLYSFSGSFISLQRYTLQWFAFAAVMICAALSALEGAWPAVSSRIGALWRKLFVSKASKTDCPLVPFAGPAKALWEKLPAVLCAILCVWSFAFGTSETGYNNNFYRYSHNVFAEDQFGDAPFLRRYALLMAAEKHLPDDGKILLTRMGYQYPIHARGYILTSNPIVPLMNLPLAEIPDALEKMGIVMLATEPDFWDERYFAKSTLSDYLNALPPEQILQDGSTMRLYILDAELAKEIRSTLEAMDKFVLFHILSVVIDADSDTVLHFSLD